MRNRWTVPVGTAVVAVLAVGVWWFAALAAGRDSAPPPPTGNAAGAPGAPEAASPPATATAPAPGETAAAPADASSPEQAAAPEHPAGTAPGADPGEDPTPPAGEVPPPTPSPAAAPATGAPLEGTARRTDATGDLADSAGRPPPEPQPAADLTEVALSGDGDELVVEFTLAGAVPSRASSLVWSLDVWLDEELAYTVTAQLVGSRLVAGVLDWASGEQVAPPAPPEVSGPSVTMRVPRELLERVDGPFQWQALAQADGGYEDHVPADGVLDWFPAPAP